MICGCRITCNVSLYKVTYLSFRSYNWYKEFSLEIWQLSFSLSLPAKERFSKFPNRTTGWMMVYTKTQLQSGTSGRRQGIIIFTHDGLLCAYRWEMAALPIRRRRLRTSRRTPYTQCHAVYWQIRDNTRSSRSATDLSSGHIYCLRTSLIEGEGIGRAIR